MKLRGSKAIVTGGSRGIGFAIAKKLLELGADVVIAGKNTPTLELAMKKAEPYKPHILAWDIADISQLPMRFEQAVSMLGGFDILVNNAGVIQLEHNDWDDIFQINEADWDYVMNINEKAAFFMMQIAAKYMMTHQTKGNILNISSVAAYEPVTGPYGASKAVVYGLTRGWGKRLAPQGIVVNGIAPGPVATDMNDWKEGDSMTHPCIPLGRYSTAEEIAELAAFLLSCEGENIIGHTVTSDGAYAIR